MIYVINYAMLLSIVIFAFSTSRYFTSAALAFLLAVFEICEYGIEHYIFLMLCEFVVAIFIAKDTLVKKGDSPILKYNPFYASNVLSPKVKTFACSIFIVVSIARVAFFFLGNDSNISIPKEDVRRDCVNRFISEIVNTYKRGGDYRSVANKNPFPNDEFVRRVIMTLLREYGRLDAMKENISETFNNTEAQGVSEIQRLSGECFREASGVVKRLQKAGIGEKNAARMSEDFSSAYIKLGERCKRRLRNIQSISN